jgi:hypothetical protein
MTGGQKPLLDVRGSGSWDSDAQTARSESSLEAGTAGGIWLHIDCLRERVETKLVASHPHCVSSRSGSLPTTAGGET